ncbi:hypothetical protein BBD40_12835 [Paenibacillus ihbetae]|uniref:Uncharacterized protein n=1 Tax=Paenibacillus ihbetae TaxID=1870820 RepID=A0ABX3JZQ6_9BACL|nr:hypothetical protein BBD40_12835 [Paenibacillus ihbetae]
MSLFLFYLFFCISMFPTIREGIKQYIKKSENHPTIREEGVVNTIKLSKMELNIIEEEVGL